MNVTKTGDKLKQNMFQSLLCNYFSKENNKIDTIPKNSLLMTCDKKYKTKASMMPLYPNKTHFVTPYQKLEMRRKNEQDLVKKKLEMNKINLFEVIEYQPEDLNKFILTTFQNDAAFNACRDITVNTAAVQEKKISLRKSIVNRLSIDLPLLTASTERSLKSTKQDLHFKAVNTVVNTVNTNSPTSPNNSNKHGDQDFFLFNNMKSNQILIPNFSSAKATNKKRTIINLKAHNVVTLNKPISKNLEKELLMKHNEANRNPNRLNTVVCCILPPPF